MKRVSPGQLRQHLEEVRVRQQQRQRVEELLVELSERFWTDVERTVAPVFEQVATLEPDKIDWSAVEERIWRILQERYS